MNPTNPFKWRHYSSEIILLCVRWYCRYCFSYRNLEEMMNERGLKVGHTTIYRWVQLYGAELKKKLRTFVKRPNDSWRVDEAYIKIKAVWHYLYRAIDSNGETIDFYLSERRDASAALTIFKKLAKAGEPRVINVDKHASYPPAFSSMQKEGSFMETNLRKVKYLNNLLEQGLETARNTIDRIETISGGNAYDVKTFIESLFQANELAA